MTTCQLQRLIDWLDALSIGASVKEGVYFTERDLEFSTDQQQRVVRIHLSSLFLPNWSEASLLTLEFPLAEIDLPAATEDLKLQLAKFIPVSHRYENNVTLWSPTTIGLRN